MLERTTSPSWCRRRGTRIRSRREPPNGVAETADRYGDAGSGPEYRGAPGHRGLRSWRRVGGSSARPSLPANALVELDSVALLGGLAAFLATHSADLAEEVVAVALLRRLATLPASLGPGHLLRVRAWHWTTS